LTNSFEEQLSKM